jgi:hypothetical protein
MRASVRPTFHDYDEQRACKRKRRYTSKRSAKFEAKRLSTSHFGAPVAIYECEYCGGWHLSHRQSKQERKSNAHLNIPDDPQGPRAATA